MVIGLHDPPWGESDTRSKLLDPAIHPRGWTEEHIRREETAGAVEIIDGKPRRRSKGRVDYTLRVKVSSGDQPVALGVIEAKAGAQITADNLKYFGEPVYEYSLGQGIEDGYLATMLNNLYADWCSQQGKQTLDAFAFKCTAAGGKDYLAELRGATRSHFIATTVELLTTGVDVPALRNIVFFKYVHSPISFYQMIGRGTRIDVLLDTKSRLFAA